MLNLASGAASAQWFLAGLRVWGGRLNWSETDDNHGLHPEGMSAISRGLSEATPPEEFGKTNLHPEGMPARFNPADIGNLPASLQDANLCSKTPTGGIADAQPPANCCDPFGMKARPSQRDIARQTDPPKLRMNLIFVPSEYFVVPSLHLSFRTIFSSNFWASR